MSDGTLRVVVLGLNHDHVWGNLDALAQHGELELVAAADPRPELRERVRAYGCDRLYDEPEQVLSEVDADIAYIFADNRQSAELAVEAMRRGLHVMVEKPMAADYAQAARMVAVARSSEVQLMVNWPIIWWPSLQHALRLIADGRIGTIYQVHYRAAHAGPRDVGCSPAFAEWLMDPIRNGGGAMMDYCSYGCALTCLLLGPPSRVTAVSGRVQKLDLLAEDNAIVVMQHAGATSTAIGSWTQIGHMTSYVPTFYGLDGTIVVQHDSLRLATRDDEDGATIPIPVPAAHDWSSATFLVHHIRSGEPITGLCSASVSLAAQEVLAAAAVSAREGRAVSLPLPVGRL